MNTSAMLKSFCDAVEQHNGKAFAELFTEDGVYHDVFYGAFAGRAKIAEMIDDWFYRTATDFRWDMHAPVSDGQTLYARYTFSYRSLLPEANGARAMFEGVAIMTLRDGRDRRIPRSRQHRDRLRRHEFCAGADREDRRKARRGAEGAAGDGAASEITSRHSGAREARTRNPEVVAREIPGSMLRIAPE